VVNTYDTFRCSVNEGAFGTTPVNGMLFDRRGAGENSTASEVIDPIIEGVSGSGIKLVNANNVHVLSGTSEANARGIEIGSGSTRNAFENIDLEANTVEDALVQGSDNQFLNLLSVSTGALGVLHFNGTGAVRNLVNGGTFNNIALDTGTVANSLIRVGYNFLGTGAITDNGTNTVKIGNINIASNTSDATVIPQGSFNGAAGSVTTPTYSFNSEPSAGLYRAALNDLRIGIGGGDVFKWLATGPVVPSSFGLVLGSTNQASLASVGGILNGMMIYCSDCTIANPCAGGGAGAFAQRTNGAWVCDGGPASAGSEHDFGAYNSANLGATTALSETIVTNASTTTAASKITTDIAGVGAGNFVAMLCTDGTACAAGNQRLTCTQACTAVAGTRTACTVQNGGTIAAGTTVTWSVTTACATTDPGVNINAHLTTP